MIRVTADVFSGRPNPEWVVEDEEAREVLRELALRPAAAAALDSGFQGLGNRGLIVEVMSDDMASEYGVPSTFRLAGGGEGDISKGLEVAERLIRGMSKGTPSGDGANTQESLLQDQEFQQSLLTHLGSVRGTTVTVAAESRNEEEPAAGQAGDVEAAACMIEVGTFNPSFWNDPAYITRNNCYNYASNRRTNTFAQPGRASGQMYSAINCAQVGAGAVRDGARQSPNCAPASENPRWYMALVIAPGYDYHWYRKSREGFWGHKPGGTAARNVDNANRIIHDPRTANRGPYTIFCNFFFAQRRMVVR